MKISKNQQRKKEINRLESKFAKQMNDLEEVRAKVKQLTDSARGLIIKIDPQCPKNNRTKVLHKIMMDGGRITKSVDEKGNPISGRFGAMFFGDLKKHDFDGVGLLYFSKEFVELEKQVVETRARIIALKNNIEIKNVESLEPPISEPDMNLSHIGIMKNWDEASEMVKKLFETGCVHYFSSINSKEMAEGKWVATDINIIPLDKLSAMLEEIYPDPKKINMFINEIGKIEDVMKKQLVAIPLNDEDLN